MMMVIRMMKMLIRKWDDVGKNEDGVKNDEDD